MKLFEKEANQYLMENIQIVLKKDQLLKPADFQKLLKLEDWQEVRFLLGKFGYKLAEPVTIAEVDRFYRENMLELKHLITETAIPTDLITAFFILRESIDELAQHEFADFDQEILAKYAEVIKEEKSPLLVEYAKVKIDFFFIKILFTQPQVLPKYEKSAIGHLSASELTKMALLHPEKRFESLQKSYYHRLFEESSQLVAMEKYFDNYITSLFKEYRHQVRGMEGIFAYVQDKSMELFNLRLLLKGKLYQLPEKQLTERMRQLNVTD